MSMHSDQFDNRFAILTLDVRTNSLLRRGSAGEAALLQLIEAHKDRCTISHSFLAAKIHVVAKPQYGQNELQVGEWCW